MFLEQSKEDLMVFPAVACVCVCVCVCARACIYVHAEGDYSAKYAGVSTEV